MSHKTHNKRMHSDRQTATRFVDRWRGALYGIIWHTKFGIYTIFGMWPIYEHRNVPKQIRSLPIDILKRYEKWKDIVSISGPPGLRQIKGFHDESLRGEWKGHRSSRLGKQYRVLYRIEKDQILIQVVSISAHDYRKKWYERLQNCKKTNWY